MERNEENEMLKLSEIDVNKCFIDDALQFFVENRMTIEASALLQKMKEKGIKPYDENFKL